MKQSSCLFIKSVKPEQYHQHSLDVTGRENTWHCHLLESHTEQILAYFTGYKKAQNKNKETKTHE